MVPFLKHILTAYISTPMAMAFMKPTTIMDIGVIGIFGGTTMANMATPSR
jgi:hypothetical protein